MKRVLSIAVIILAFNAAGAAQNHSFFQREVDSIVKRYSSKAGSANLIVFTGSSSIRFWHDLNSAFPGRNIINTGFGGSKMSDLLYFRENTILRYRPETVLIYEGDNDIASGKNPEEVLSEADSLLSLIHERLPDTKVIMLSVKPSPSRWQLREKYLDLNMRYRALPSKYGFVSFADMWSPLVGSSGRPRGEFFLADSLHLNGAGYSVWAEVLRKVLN